MALNSWPARARGSALRRTTGPDGALYGNRFLFRAEVTIPRLGCGELKHAYASMDSVATVHGKYRLADSNLVRAPIRTKMFC